jgi:hypothetical protein
MQIQTQADINNVLVFGLRAFNIDKFTGFVLQRHWHEDYEDVKGKDWAFVNIYLGGADGDADTGPRILSSLYLSIQHLICWHWTCRADKKFTGDPDLQDRSGAFRFSPMRIGTPATGPATDTVIGNPSIAGNCFQFGQTEENYDYEPWGQYDGVVMIGGGAAPIDENHWDETTVVTGIWDAAQSRPYSIGSNTTTGDQLLNEFGRPVPSSPLLNRVTPLLVPNDLAGVARTAPSACGAYEMFDRSILRRRMENE